MTNYPNSLIYLTGAIVVDLPEEVKLPSQPNQFQTVSLTGSTLNLTFHPLEQAILQLRDQYVVGTLQAKIIQPRPEF